MAERLAILRQRTGAITHVEHLPARDPEFAPWPGWVAEPVRLGFTRAGIDRLWSHQAAAAELVRAGTHVAVATGTASGKSLCYLLPALTRAHERRGRLGQRGSTTLYLSPTKALARDQAARLSALGIDGLRIATHDGDSSPEERDWTRDFAEYVLTNPDMLHHSLLPDHARWHRFLSKLDHVVIDEMHHYRGVFGAHVAQIIRRLRRVCAEHGAEPTFVLASATTAEPATTAQRLIGLPVTGVVHDGSPRPETRVVLWEPPLAPGGGENGAPVRRSAHAEAADLLTDAVIEGVSTLAFVRSRRGAETVAAMTARLLHEVDPALTDRVAAYRGGYLPEERRALEDALRSGRLRALAATTALELGIDVSGLDMVVVAGFPGTRAALWQQWGRAGRGDAPALGVLIARDDPLDTYLVHHPDALFGQPVESFVFDPDNPYVLGPHLCAAAAEVPLTADGPASMEIFGPQAQSAVAALTAAGLLRRRPRGWFWTDRRRASALADIRSSGGPAVNLIESGSGRVIGTVDHASAPASVHEGAVYLHQGETWVVDSLDVDDAVAILTRDDPDHTTSARELTDIAIIGTSDRRDLQEGQISFGEVEVTRRVVSYLKRRVSDGGVIGEVPLDLPPQKLRTRSVWWTLSDTALEALADADLAGAAHAAEHASIGMLPMFATCDRWDIGGVSTRLHPDTGELTVFVYDGHSGGAGFAERGFTRAHDWLTATRDAILTCTCAEGCPSCVQSPKCGNQNHPLDKSGAVALLNHLIGS